MAVKKKDHDDVLELFRKIVGSLQLSDIKNFDSLKGDDRHKFLLFCNTVYTSDFFEQIIRNIIFEYTMKAANAEEVKDTMINRSAANGVNMIQSFFKKYSLRYEKEFQGRKEEFDERSSFEPIKQ